MLARPLKTCAVVYGQDVLSEEMIQRLSCRFRFEHFYTKERCFP